jgi:hypothetical protein
MTIKNTRREENTWYPCIVKAPLHLYDSATINQMLNMFKKKRCCIMILFSSSNFKPRQEAGDNL